MELLLLFLDIALENGQNPNQKVQYRDENWKNSKTLRSRDATWSRYTGIDIQSLALNKPIAQSHSGTLYRGKWQGNDIVARVLNIPEVTVRISRDFQTEFPNLRFVFHFKIFFRKKNKVYIFSEYLRVRTFVQFWQPSINRRN